MATQKKVVKKVSFVHFQKLLDAVSLLSFVVALIASGKAGNRTSHSMIVAFTIMAASLFVSRMIIKVLASYEEMNSGKG